MALSQDVLLLSKINNYNNFFKTTNSGSLQNIFSLLSIRTSKHWDPRWKWHRKQKVIPVILPDPHEKRSKEKMKAKMKEWGIMPARYWKERPFTITASHSIHEPYEPPKADGKASFLSKERALDLAGTLNKKKDTILAVRKIRSYEPNFELKHFPQIAEDIYLKAHETLMTQDPEKLVEFATDKAVQEMLDGLKLKTLRWKFLESLEPPVVVQVKSLPVLTKTNLFAQITVRFHTKQSLAIYDRFGRLYYGSEILAKDVLEYVVFEKHIVHEYGVWRLHGKIIPDWSSDVAEQFGKTFRLEEVVMDDEEDEFIEEDQVAEDVSETEIVKSETGAVKA